MQKRIFYTLILCAVVGWSTLTAQQLPEPMQPARLVNDFTGMLTAGQQDALESKLVAFDRQTSTQIAVVTVPDLEGAAISDYAQRLFDKWGVGGSSQKNNGVLILVKPKEADSKGKVFIATGYGIEGVVPDALAGRIVDYDILPSFREGHYYEGIDKAVNTLISLTKGEYTAEEYLARKEKPSGAAILIGVIIFIILVSAISSRSKVGTKHTISSGGDVATAILLGSLLSGSGRSHGGGGFGGFSGGGGGFGGFGGGFSGGGGAGGSW